MTAGNWKDFAKSVFLRISFQKHQFPSKKKKLVRSVQKKGVRFAHFSVLHVADFSASREVLLYPQSVSR